MDTERTIIVLDDDPTGTQTVRQVPVLTGWSVEEIKEEFERNTPLFFILTNTRAFPEEVAQGINRAIGEAIRQTKRPFWVISRGDSTLRGHFPSETDALAEGLGWGDDFLYVLLPAFFEGRRFTQGDVHYLQEQGRFVPVGESEYAKDETFGYRNSNLKDWVEEKSEGRIQASQISSLSIQELEGSNDVHLLQVITQADRALIVNAIDMRHIDRFSAVVARSSRRIVFRTAASFVSSFGGFGKVPLLTAEALKAENGAGGGLIIVGSHVPKTTLQLSELLKADVDALEFDIATYLQSGQGYVQGLSLEIQSRLSQNRDVVVYTSRTLRKGNDRDDSLRLSTQISDGLVGLVSSLPVQPSFLISKGGITSSDIATKGLKISRAMVMGQVLPGVPVWRADAGSKFPGLKYVIFPGNVGEADSLFQAYQKIKNDKNTPQA
ncbi:uncharacterized protein YgbK (DUF1537 family) [Dyadobacter jejuensis]|uniref:Uncharacterized protein YgbK (DUF1537 family) n=1 Tax=Dyadobacter jejuensis TaxID=1082580 RepID=A0A316AIR9_9BACT|nr:four-carbon acid sugar kinase family protein [Dyadobacter jejuensis]PWJ56864.1 uncharacterized protein YgbK (DUF1537 family) [Dyadobacter jejuensis]